jgi:hypothetical protein
MFSFPPTRRLLLLQGPHSFAWVSSFTSATSSRKIVRHPPPRTADLPAHGPGERPPLVAEQLALEQSVGREAQLTARNGFELRPAQRVDIAGDDLLARAAFPREQDRAVAPGYARKIR